MSRLKEKSSISSGVACSPPTVVTVVDQAEKAFLKRSFKRALYLSNQFLLEEEERLKKKIDCNSQEIISIEIRCTNDDIFPWDRVGDDMETYELKIDPSKTAKPDHRNRALAVALQSWFEISRNTQEDGYQYLVPFCRALTGTPVTLELLLILLRFYVGVGQPGWSIHVATACLNQCRWSPQLFRHDGGSASSEVLKEISEILLIELLPFHPRAVRSSVEWLNSEYTIENRPELKNDIIWKSSPSRIRKGTLETLISSMNPDMALRNLDEVEWFKTSLKASFTKWKTMLIDAEKEEEENRKNSMVVRAQKQFNWSSLLSLSRHIETRCLRLLRRLKRLLLDFQTAWKNGALDYKLAGAATAFSFVVLAYRYHRRKWLALLRAAIYEAVVQPVKEVVEALQLL